MRYESRKERLAASGKVRLCLNMISTDEEHIMQRCLDNVAHLISDGAMVVAYNGRREDTVKVIEEFAKHRQIPVRITRRLWERNFGKSRTEALRDAEAFLREIDPKNEFVWYIFFMDADNQIFADDGRSPLPINRDLLKEDCMVADMTTSGPGKIRYDYHWMVRYDPTGQRRWKWCSPLHEYLEREGQWAPTLGKIQGGYVLSGRDGTRSKSPLKYLEDALVFEAELKVDPENARNLYYRAQSYRDAGLPEMAERCFKIRADGPTGKWKKWNDEYTYLALVQAGKIRFHQGNYDAETIDLFERAFEKRPRRLEAPYFLLFMWRLQGKPHQGWALARYVLSLPVHDDRIFVDYEIHAWQFNWEASIAACNAGDKPAYRELAAKVINSPETPDKIRKQVTAELAKFG